MTMGHCQSNSSGLIENKLLSGEDRLLDYLFTSEYNSLTRPVRNFSDTVEVKFWLELTQLIDVDEKSQMISTNVWMYQRNESGVIGADLCPEMAPRNCMKYTWKDWRLFWNPTDFEGLNSLPVPAEYVWTPDTALLTSNDNEMPGFPLVHIDLLMINLYADGSILKVVPGVLYTPCIMDIKYFPVDSQQCHMEFESWSYSSDLLTLIPRFDEVHLTKYIPNLEWNVVSSPITSIVRNFNGVHGEETFMSILVTLNIQRMPLYYVVNLIVPCVMLCPMSEFTITPVPSSVRKIFLGKIETILMCKTTKKKQSDFTGVSISTTTVHEDMHCNSTSSSFHRPLSHSYEPGAEIDSAICDAHRMQQLYHPFNDSNNSNDSCQMIEVMLGQMLMTLDKIVNRFVPTKYNNETHRDWLRLAAVIDRILLITFAIINIAGAAVILPQIT
uniref:Neuronal acetylcholine receptor subunit alpha-2-like n=1 Tax=Saccoglossus kowalevskii TaxID=10224 RepID=A0ABM0LVD2_SACKO|nr:PREDICTED: neuronal acetylcholine receptor subunit alpha-2-like [Saccoglossus kowalevskii]